MFSAASAKQRIGQLTGSVLRGLRATTDAIDSPLRAASSAHLDLNGLVSACAACGKTIELGA
jgi:hypothetical protein